MSSNTHSRFLLGLLSLNPRRHVIPSLDQAPPLDVRDMAREEMGNDRLGSCTLVDLDIFSIIFGCHFQILLHPQDHQTVVHHRPRRAKMRESREKEKDWLRKERQSRRAAAVLPATARRRIVNQAKTHDNRRIVKLSTHEPTQSQARTFAFEEEAVMGGGETGPY